LAVTGETGNWQYTVLPPAVYTVSVTLPEGLVPTARAVVQVPISPTAQLTGQNFGAAPFPTADVVRDFQFTRAAAAISLSWVITNSLVDVIYIERATTPDGDYDRVGERAIGEDVTSSTTLVDQPTLFSDPLPARLSSATVYYRLVLSPGDATFGPVAVAPTHALFMPTVKR